MVSSHKVFAPSAGSPWCEWLVHSHFSFLNATSSPQELIETADALGYSGLALCDFDGVYGLARAYRAWLSLKNRLKNRDFRFFYGAEIHHAADHYLPILMQDTTVLFSKNHNGYFALCELLTLAHTR